MREQNGIYSYMDCSTIHIKEEDNDWLTRHVWESRDPTYVMVHEIPHLVVREHDYGYWINVPSDETHLLELQENTKIPITIKDLLQKAKENDCYWINLDQDGHEYDDLPKYIW